MHHLAGSHGADGACKRGKAVGKEALAQVREPALKSSCVSGGTQTKEG